MTDASVSPMPETEERAVEEQAAPAGSLSCLQIP